jgi:hypothetical protein
MFIPGGMDIGTERFDVHTGGYGHRYGALRCSYRGVWKSIPGGMEIGTGGYGNRYRGVSISVCPRIDHGEERTNHRDNGFAHRPARTE